MFLIHIDVKLYKKRYTVLILLITCPDTLPNLCRKVETRFLRTTSLGIHGQLSNHKFRLPASIAINSGK
jgi:hypothetical protein